MNMNKTKIIIRLSQPNDQYINYDKQNNIKNRSLRIFRLDHQKTQTTVVLCVFYQIPEPTNKPTWAPFERLVHIL